MRLDGRTALITGGTQGIGAAIALTLAEAGCDLVLHGLQEDEHSRLTLKQCEAAGARVHAVFTDMAGPTEEGIADLVRQVDEVTDQVSLLVNNAGTYCEEPFLQLSPDAFERTLRLNVHAGFFLTQAYARRWVKDHVAGRVVFTGSINGELAEADHTAYDTSKGAVRMMVRRWPFLFSALLFVHPGEAPLFVFLG